jgi:hypothetical protein
MFEQGYCRSSISTIFRQRAQFPRPESDPMTDENNGVYSIACNTAQSRAVDRLADFPGPGCQAAAPATTFK